ncbi:membrane hypothetical protein [uncultured Pleomorphomonas sp.]|uniref:Transmembrane protein n=1 Tax=uncultured Pleomorphomonas sp. TaxID=442121 RepID=A0A212LF87_9HYPH|nr:hypothetical protein [uncultured Pleomorphomonas sp.]SCM76205.1 membrane hypothetical protein [uncultured Pleomorphomonas sp.]
MARGTISLLHGLVLVGLLIAAVALATWWGALWPLDLGFSARMAAGGFVLLLFGWGPLWLAPLLVSALLNRHWQRLALWPFAVLAMIALHAAFGPARGFMAIDRLGMAGALDLYALPAAMAVLLGSALREGFRRKSTSDVPDRAGPVTAGGVQSRSG